MVKTRYIILEALLISVCIFTFGILVGIFIENARTNFLQQNFVEIETNTLDARLLSDLIDSSDCNLAVKENIQFADRVFLDARYLNKYEESNQLTESVKLQHIKYDLLRIIIWTNSIKIKEKCHSNYHNVVYIYKYDKTTLTDKAKQTVISNLLSEIKGEKGDKILLLSFAGDTNIPSVNLILNRYNITQQELPVILIDEKIKITDLKDKSELEEYLD
jgi:hypothetical protein